MDIYVDLDKDSLTGGLQLSIGDDSGGHRLAGPKYSGHSSRIQRKKLSAHDAQEIRAYLDKGFPLSRKAGPCACGHTHSGHGHGIFGEDGERPGPCRFPGCECGDYRPEDPKDIIIRTLTAEVERLAGSLEECAADLKKVALSMEDRRDGYFYECSAAAARALLARLEARP